MALAKDPICSIQTSTLLEDGSDGFISQAVNYQPEQPHSLINFKGSWYDNFIHRSNGPLLSFEQNEKGRQHTTCLRTSGYKHGHSMVNQWDPRAVEDFSCFETASNGDWLYYDEVVFADSSSIQDPGSLKLISGGGRNQALKKQCTNETEKGKTKSEPLKESQSIAAKVEDTTRTGTQWPQDKILFIWLLCVGVEFELMVKQILVFRVSTIRNWFKEVVQTLSSVLPRDKLVVELGLDLFAVNDEKFKDTFVSPAAIEVLQHKRQSLQNRKK
ncbi:hypothetical protein Goklo_027965, partial [Gossypium klotzschianum]|nr:hypothetical protein [Gossypium klotzschianum]